MRRDLYYGDPGFFFGRCKRCYSPHVALLHDYDVRHKAFRFDVEQGQPRETVGLVTFGGRWEYGGQPA